MEKSKFETVTGHCLEMNKEFEYKGFNLNIKVEFAKLFFNPQGQRRNYITITEIGNPNLACSRYNDDDEYILGDIFALTNLIKKRIDEQVSLELSKAQKKLRADGFI